jgi:hypothetical protein
MKTQSQFYNNETAMEYWEQYFTTQTPTSMTIEQLREIKRILDDLTHLLSEGHKVNVQLETVEE